MTEIVFLPGAGGSADFWCPVADRLPSQGRHRFLGWPGLGNEPAAPGITGMDDLVGLLLSGLSAPVDIVAQSMGGVVAVKVALAAPQLVRRLVLTATSAGVPMADLGAVDWRPEYRAAYPAAARWIEEPTPDLSAVLPAISAPTLLLWGDADVISPVAVGERILGLLPVARLHVIAGGGHDLAQTHAEEAATAIGRHLG